MASRTMTRLKLAKARNDGLLVDLKHQDFEVSFKQLPEIIADAGLPITEMAELRELWHRTRGWVAGLRLLARNKVRTPAKATNSPGFAKSRELLDYFEQEVFAGLSDAARGALDVMLTPRRLVHDLMLTLGGDEEAAAYLDELEAQGLLTRLPHQAVRTYRAAPLLVEATRAHSLLASEEVAALHRRCCDWFEAQGQLTVAAAHAVDGGDIQRAILLIERCGIAMIADGDITELQSWLPSLPLADLRRHPIALLAVATGRCRYFTGWMRQRKCCRYWSRILSRRLHWRHNVDANIYGAAHHAFIDARRFPECQRACADLAAEICRGQ